MTLPDSLAPLARRVQEVLYHVFESNIATELGPFHDKLRDQQAKAAKSGDVLQLAELGDADPTELFLFYWHGIFGRHLQDIGQPETWTRSKVIEVGLHAVGYSRDLLHLGSVDVTLRSDGEFVQLDYGDQAEVWGDKAGRIAEVLNAAPAHTRVSAPVAEAIRVSMARMEAGRLPSLTSDVLAPTDGVAGVYLGTRSGRHIAYARINEKVVALRVTPPAEGGAEQPFARAVLGRESLGGLHHWIEGAQAELETLRELRHIPGYLRQTSDRLDSLYGPLATIVVPEDRLLEAINKMAQTGFCGLFGENPDLVRGLAAISTQGDLYLNPKTIVAKFEELGIEYEPVMQALRTYAATYNLFQVVKFGEDIRGTL